MGVSLTCTDAQRMESKQVFVREALAGALDIVWEATDGQAVGLGFIKGVGRSRIVVAGLAYAAHAYSVAA